MKEIVRNSHRLPGLRRRHRLHNFTLSLMLMLLTACDVHEFPDKGRADAASGLVPFTLHLRFDTELPLYQEITHTVRSSTKAASDIRYQVSAYRSETRQYTRTADTTLVFTKSESEPLEDSLRLYLPEGQYKFIVWTDYVDAGSRTDKHYDTSDWSEIRVQGTPHPGNTDYRDAFRGTVESRVTADTLSYGTGVNRAEVAMQRPLAKYKFITTDYHKFVDYIVEQQALSLSRRQSGREPEDADTKTGDSRSIDPTAYRIVFRYSGNMPDSYNIYTDKPSDVRTGVWYESRLTPTDEREAELGFDYLFVNGSESKIQVSIELYDEDDKLLTVIPTIELPVIRSRQTVVKGDFLTAESGGGVSIQPEFDGEYNIEYR